MVGGLLLCAGAFVIFYALLLRPMVAGIKEDREDILKHGLPATGIVKTARASSGRGGSWMHYTVEFQLADRTEPTRFDFSVERRRYRLLAEGESVAVHYPEKWPSLAVIDELVK